MTAHDRTPRSGPVPPVSAPMPAAAPVPSLPPDPDALTVDIASTLLQLGLSGPRRPVDGLIDRLGEPDGPAWLQSILRRFCPDGRGPEEVFAHGRATLEELTAIKERSKRLLKETIDVDGSLAGVAGYFLALAAALRHHGRLIGSRGRQELDGILLDLAAVAPAPYSRLLSDATLVPA